MHHSHLPAPVLVHDPTVFVQRPLHVPSLKHNKGTRPTPIDFVRDSVVIGHKTQDPGREVTRNGFQSGFGQGTCGTYGGSMSFRPPEHFTKSAYFPNSI